VKVYNVQRTAKRRLTTSDGKSSHGLWPGGLITIYVNIHTIVDTDDVI